MSYWIEEDELDCVVLEGNDSDIMDSAKQKKHNAFVEEPFYCCICGMDISFFPYIQTLLYSHLTRKNEQQRNDHVNLCLSRSEHGKSTKRNISDFFSKKTSTPPSYSLFPVNGSLRNASSGVSVNALTKLSVHKPVKRKRMTRQQKDSMKEDEPIDVPNSIMVPFCSPFHVAYPVCQRLF